MSKILVRGIAINPVLKTHMEMTFPIENIKTSAKRALKAGLQIFMDSTKIRNKTVLIYNSSIANIFLALILRLNNNRVIFHLHDPIPHSGILNPIIFFSNFLMVSISNVVLVFSKNLREQTEKFYFKKSIYIVSHGINGFNYYKTDLKKQNKTVIGFFGRNMPYKNYDSFLDAVKNYPNYQFITVGSGYPSSKLSNLKIYSGYINNDVYYSLMKDVDYLFFSHSKISYSGVLSDAINLGKSIIVSNKAHKKVPYTKKTQLMSNLPKVKNENRMTTNSWHVYKSSLNLIL
jgi:glycosyltransferase involved in cell wall biosynthesis